jgi:hypothetical protein
MRSVINLEHTRFADTVKLIQPNDFIEADAIKN